jgi:hypothetical protein
MVRSHADLFLGPELISQEALNRGVCATLCARYMILPCRARLLQMLNAIQERLGVAKDAESDLAQLEMETKPEDMLTEILRLRRLEP